MISFTLKTNVQKLSMKDILIKKMGIIFKILAILFFSISITNAELLKPNSNIKPSKVVKIQLDGLQKNDLNYKDSGIEQTSNPLIP